MTRAPARKTGAAMVALALGAIATPGALGAIATPGALGGEFSEAARTERASPGGDVVPLRRADLPIGREYRPHLAPFALKVEWAGTPVLVQRAVLAIPVLPGEVVELSGADPGTTRAEWSAGSMIRTENGWSWTAPQRPGAYGARFVGPGGAVHLNLLVMHRTNGGADQSLLGYRIGEYRPRPRGMGPEYEPPRGFISVEEADRDILVSPHVTLGDLLCKQPGEPRLVHFTPFLTGKLEAVLEEVNRRGIPAPSLTLMSAFRTPHYNTSIGNRTYLSRHLWGDAADIFIDANNDGEMDDLNGDGRVNVEDARHLADIIDGLMTDPPAGIRHGGLSSYSSNAAHGPFVHVDARGQQARW